MENKQSTDLQPSGFPWADRSKLVMLQIEELLKKILPCPIDKVIAEVRYLVGLSENKANSYVNTFVAREIVDFKKIVYKGNKKVCMVFCK